MIPERTEIPYPLICTHSYFPVDDAYFYFPTGDVGRTCRNGKGVNILTQTGMKYRPRSRKYNPRWAAKMRAVRQLRNKLLTPPTPPE